MKNRSLLLLVLGLAVLFQPGCGGLSDAKQRNDLKQTGLAWHEFNDEKKKPPASWDELIAYYKGKYGEATSLERARDAKYDLKWNLKFSDAKEGMANTVLGEKPGGGMKLMLDGSVK